MAVHKIHPVEGSMGDLMDATFQKHGGSGFINVDGCILPQHYKKFADAIENFQVRSDDVWVLGFPKSGTTWTAEMVWSIANDLEFERGKSPISKRVPLLELSLVIEAETGEPIRSNPTESSESTDFLLDSVSYAASLSSPRFIKTHLPPKLLPRQLRTGEKKPKIVYVCRNPKDTCISFYHHSQFVLGYRGNFEDFSTLFLGGTVHWGPFWKNVLGFWNKKNDYNMLFIKYEDMKKDLSSVIKKTAMFLGKDLTSAQVSLLTEHLSFSSMKLNPAVNREETMALRKKLLGYKQDGVFMRNGTAEQWKSAMNPELIQQFDDWINDHLNGTGLSL